MKKVTDLDGADDEPGTINKLIETPNLHKSQMTTKVKVLSGNAVTLDQYIKEGRLLAKDDMKQ